MYLLPLPLAVIILALVPLLFGLGHPLAKSGQLIVGIVAILLAVISGAWYWSPYRRRPPGTPP